MPDEIELSHEQEAAVDAAWAEIPKLPRKSRGKKPKPPAQHARESLSAQYRRLADAAEASGDPASASIYRRQAEETAG